MNKFKVGDIIKRNDIEKPGGDYSITNKAGQFKVIKGFVKDSDYITVEVINHARDMHKGDRYTVKSRYFEKIEGSIALDGTEIIEREPGEFRIGDIVESTGREGMVISKLNILGGPLYEIKFKKAVSFVSASNLKLIKFKKAVSFANASNLKLIKPDKLKKTFIANKKQRIIEEIKKDKEFIKCFDNVEKEVKEWSDEMVINYKLNKEKGSK